MTRQDGTPVTPQGGNAPADGPVTAPVAPVAAGAVMPMRRAERSRAVARRGGSAVAEAARELWLHPDRFLYAQAHPEPETMREHWAHIRSREWVPEGMTGGAERLVTLAGILHHLIVACPVKAAAKAARFAALKVDEAADRPLRLYGWLLLALIVILILGII